MTVNVDNKTWPRFSSQVSGGWFYSDVDKVPVGWVSGAPTLTSVTGSFTNGGALTINGSNISANRNGQWLYEKFTGGADGQAALAGKGFNAGADSQYLYETTGAPAGRTSFAQRDTLGLTNDDTTAARLQFPAGGFSKVAVHVDFRLETPDRTGFNGNGAQDKLFRLVAGTSDLHTNGPNFGWTWLYEDNGSPPAPIDWLIITQKTETGTAPTMPNPTIDGVQGLWGRWSIMWQASSGIGVADGRQLMKSRWTHGPVKGGQPYHAQDGAHSLQSWKMSPINTLMAGDIATTIGQLFLPFYQRNTQQSRWGVANIFVNDSFEQVLFGEAATLEACDPAKIICQPMTGRGNGSVSVATYFGPNNELAAGDVYAYVFNADGSYNETGILVNAANTLNITGAGFGTGPAYVLFDRTDGTDGADVPNDSPEIGVYAGVNPNIAEPTNRPRYKALHGRTWLTERRHPAVEDGLQHQAGLKFLFNSGDEFRVSYRTAVPPGKRWCTSTVDAPPTANLSHHKPIWLGTDSAVNDGIGGTDNAPDLVVCTFTGSGGSRASGGNTSIGSARWYNGFSTNSMTVGTQTWCTWYQKYNVADDLQSQVHQMIVCETAFQQDQKNGSVFGAAGLVQYHYDLALIPGWFGNQSEPAAASPKDYTNVDHLLADISISVGANAGKMLLLGDASTLSACTRVYEVPADSWADGQIVATVRDWEKLSHYFVVNKSTVLASGVTGW